MRDPSGIFVTVRGDPGAEQRLYLLVGTHGQEIAGPIALKQLLEGEWRWPNVSMIAVWQDPRGYEEEGYGFLSAEGDESCWPPLWGYRMNQERFWVYIDENSAWGNTAVIPPRHQAMRDLMHQLQPTFCLTLHETVRSEVKQDLFWAGAGILLIEALPMSTAEHVAALDPVGDPFTNPIAWAGRLLFEWIRPMLGISRWRHTAKVLQSNPYYCLTTRIAQRFAETGRVLAGKRWMQYMEYLGDLVLGLGRVGHALDWTISDWKTATDYAIVHYGCPGVTTETFQVAAEGLRGIDFRVAQQLKYVEAVLSVLNEGE